MAAACTAGAQAGAPLAGAFALALASGPAAGQEFVPGPYLEYLADCYASAESAAEREACVGEPSRVCIEEEPQGGTTSGMAQCAGIEADAWSVLLQGEFRATMDWARAADAADAPGFGDRAAALTAAQRAWEEFVVEECRVQYAVWGSGSMRQVAGSACRMHMIAERALALRTLREEP